MHSLLVQCGVPQAVPDKFGKHDCVASPNRKVLVWHVRDTASQKAVSGCAGIARNGVSARGTSEGAVEATGATLEHKKRRGP